MKLIKQLIKIQKGLKAPKKQRNTFANYNFRSCEDIVEAVKPLLGDTTLVLTDEIVNIGNHNYVKATVILSDGKDNITATGWAREAEVQKGMNDAQLTGSSSSYARKYAMNGLFAIDDTKDADTQNNSTQPVNTQPQQTTPAQQQYNNQQDDDGKAWITDTNFSQSIKILLEKGTITTTTPAEEVMKILRQKYKIARKYQEMVQVELTK